MRLTIAYSKIKKRNLVLINNVTYQREKLSERPIRQPLSTMKWHNLRERHECHLASTMYKIMNNHVPSYLTNRFSVRDSGYNLRGHKNVLIPKPRT